MLEMRSLELNKFTHRTIADGEQSQQRIEFNSRTKHFENKLHSWLAHSNLRHNDFSLLFLRSESVYCKHTPFGNSIEALDQFLFRMEISLSSLFLLFYSLCVRANDTECFDKTFYMA